jgi:hypothetical protein
MSLLENVFLCIYSSVLEEVPGMASVFKIIELYDKYEIANIASFPDWRNEVLEHYNDIESEGKFALSFDPAPAFKKFMNNMFQALWYKTADEEWKKASGDSLSVGFFVQQGDDQDMIKKGIKSKFIVLRIIFNNENVSKLIPLFEKRFAAKYKEFLRDVQTEINRGLLAFGWYSEMPSEL